MGGGTGTTDNWYLKKAHAKEYKKYMASEKTLYGKVDRFSIVDDAEKFLKNKKYDKAKEDDKGKMLAIASELMDKANQLGHFDYGLLGFKIFSYYGLENRASVRKRFKKILNYPGADIYKNFNEGKKLFKKSYGVDVTIDSLENKVVSSIFGICALAGIYFGISGMTGAAIGLTKASSSFLGVLLFVGGIAGLFFSLKGN